MARTSMLTLLALVVAMSLTSCGGSGEETHTTLKDKARIECEEKEFALEKSFDHPSVPFEQDPYGYVEEVCEKEFGQ